MALVRVRLSDGTEKNLSEHVAKRAKLEVLDEPTTRGDGSLRRPTRKGGRPDKPKTTVAKKAAAKKASGDAGSEGAKS